MVECEHGLLAVTCDTCMKKPDQVGGSVYLPGGGTKFHLSRDCIGLVDGQKKALDSGLSNRPVELVARAWAEREGYELCLYCDRESRATVFQ